MKIVQTNKLAFFDRIAKTQNTQGQYYKLETNSVGEDYKVVIDVKTSKEEYGKFIESLNEFLISYTKDLIAN